ncbi:MAG: alkaline phosphatase family protein, partial [Candidatus Helarchaeota archaeon]
VQDPKFRLVETIIEAIEPNSSIKTAFISGKWRLPAFLAQEADEHGDGDIYASWTIRAVIECIKSDDPDFIFVNLAWLDVTGHDTGSFNLNIKRLVSQLDYNLNMLFNELKAMGEFENTLFIITGDHGMDSIYGVFDPKAYLESYGIHVHHVHAEGQSAFIYLENASQMNMAVDLLNKNDKVGLALSRDDMYLLHLDTFINRTGHVYMSCKAHYAVVLESAGIEFPVGGISCRDVPLMLMGPGIKKGQFIENKIPELVDIVPTIGNITGWNIPSTCDGRVLYEVME